MSDTLRFVKLDFQTIKPYATWKMLFAMLFVLFIFATFTDGGSTAICMIMAIGSFFVSYPFAVGEQNGIDTLYATLPIARRSVVSGRYLFALCADILSGAVSYGVLGFIETVRAGSYDWTQSSIILAVSFGLFSLIQAVQLPLYFRYGYARSKLLAYIPYIGAPLIVIGGAELLKDEQWRRAAMGLLEYASGNIGLSIAFMAVLWLVLMALSLVTSQHLYSKRDF